MDTGTAVLDVSDKLELIKTQMPGLYQLIRDRARIDGGVVYELVRRGLRGEVNCFYGFEGGRVVGTRFDLPDVDAHIALGVIEFGAATVCLINVMGTGRT